MPLPALLYQGGYLTISEAIDANTFRLGIPNMEIANSLAEDYVSSILDMGMADWTEQLADAREGMLKRGIDDPLVEPA